MTKTILPKKSNTENPFASDDEVHSMLTNDPSIQQFPQSNTVNSITTNTTQGFNTTMNTQTNNSFASISPQNNTYNPPPVQVVQNQGESLKNTGGAMQEGADVLVKNDNADWINKKWRPAMGWIYMATCTADFVLFPILWSILQVLSKGNVTSQWQPLTLQGAGLYHIAMGAVLGIAAYGRTKEKIEGATK